MSSDDYRIAYEREKKAREAAEKMLDEKTREVAQSLSLVKNQYKELEIKNNELELLVTVAKFSQEQLSLTEALEQFVSSLVEATRAPYIFVYLYSEKTNTVKIIDLSVIEKDECKALYESIRKQEDLLSEKLLSSVISKRQTICLDADKMWKEERASLMRDLGVDGAYAFPILRYGKVISIIEVGVEDWLNFQDSLVAQIESVSMQLSVALERRLSQKETEKNLKSLQEAMNNLGQAQAQLVQSEKMASLGQLAAGVAHEINNPIGFVLSNVSTLKEYIGAFTKVIKLYESFQSTDSENEKAKLAEKIESIYSEEDLEFVFEDIEPMLEDSENGLNRVKEIVNNLKSFARADEDKMQLADLNQCIRNTLKIVWNELKYNVEVKSNFGDIPMVKCNPGQIEQVIMNLLVNAGQASDKGGEISISTSLNNGHAIIEVADNGHGIPKDKLAKIFDPFFTTKPVGVGTGLGLSISYGIVQKHKGTLEVESELKKGSKFTITIPIGEAA